MLTRRSVLAGAAALAVGVVGATPADAQLGVQRERNAPATYAITNARIVTGAGPAIERGTVVVRDGVIAAVGASVAVPADARTMDGSGLTVYPGFIEGYGSLGLPAPRGGGGGGGGGGFGGGAPQSGPSAPEAPNSTRPAGQQPELSALDLLAPEAKSFEAAQGAGFTAALTAPATGIFAGQSAVIGLREGAPQEIVLRSPVALHVGFSTGRGFGGGYPTSLMGVFAVLRQTMLDAQHHAAEQAAYDANPRGRSRPQNDPSLAALQPALRGAMPVVMTANTEREIIRALDLAREFGLRPVIAGGREAHMVADRLKRENVPVLLSLDFPTRPANRPADAAPEPVRVLRERVEAPRSPAALADAGVRVAFHSGGDHAAFLGNLQKAVRNGLSREQALRALTLTPAELFGLADRLGTIETGKIANLTLVRGDVFAPGARVTRVFVDGQPVEVRAPAAGRGGRGERAALAGTWTVTVTLDATDRAVTLGLQQSGDELRGTLQGALGSTQIANGTVAADSSFSFTASITLPDVTEQATFAGKLEGNTIRGTVTIVGHEPGTFVGTRPAAPGTPNGRAGRPVTTPPSSR
ncbi:MAG TPA: amidohydrolase family protein [Gemmatimonadales bacterium]